MTWEDDKGRVIFQWKMCTMEQCKTGRRPNDEQTNTDEQTNKRTMNEQMNINKCERKTNI